MSMTTGAFPNIDMPGCEATDSPTGVLTAQCPCRPVYLDRLGDVPALADVKIPSLKSLPAEEVFDMDYMGGRAMATVPLIVNQRLAKARQLFDPVDCLQDYEDVFLQLRKPKIVKTFQNDEVFAEQRLSGTLSCPA